MQKIRQCRSLIAGRAHLGSSGSSLLCELIPDRQLDNQELFPPLTLYFHCKIFLWSSAMCTKSWKKINWKKRIDTLNGLLLLLFHHVTNYFISCFCLCALALLPPFVLGTGYGSLMRICGDALLGFAQNSCESLPRCPAVNQRRNKDLASPCWFLACRFLGGRPAVE
jgi:hypothetical protein